MPNIYCPLCKKKFDFQSHYYKHLRSSQCIKQFPINTIPNTIKHLIPLGIKNDEIPKKSTQNPPPNLINQTTLNSSINDEKMPPKNTHKHLCDCGKTFSTKSNMLRHRVSNCSRNYTTKNKNDQTITTNISQKKPKNYGNEVKKIEKKNIKSPVNEQYITPTQNNQQIIFNINYYEDKSINIKNSKNKNIYINYADKKINNFGNENTEYIIPENYQSIFNNPFNCLLSLINDIHFNPKHPENMNLKRPNARSNFIEVFIDGNWNKTPISSVVHNLINTKMDEMDNIATKLVPDENNIKRQCYEQWAENVCNMVKQLHHIDDNLNLRDISKLLPQDNKHLYKSLHNFLDNQFNSKI